MTVDELLEVLELKAFRILRDLEELHEAIQRVREILIEEKQKEVTHEIPTCKT